MNTIKKYLSLIKFSHSIFALPFAIIGFFLGFNFLNKQKVQLWNINKRIGFPDSTSPYLVVGLLCFLCMIFARSAAMAFNRYLDRNIDAKNPRTKIREIPSGVITPKNALLFTIVNSIAFVVCCYFINTLCFYLSFVAFTIEVASPAL